MNELRSFGSVLAGAGSDGPEFTLYSGTWSSSELVWDDLIFL